tara:strand:+ start:3509 stop:5680 length:2172 start_codon:yes stop_codon:yes gene_type:complete
MIESKIETKHIITDLSVTEKICLYNALYEDLAAKGIEGDTELAHVNKAEMVVLRDMGGSGTINPDTGLIQFVGGSPPPPPPSGNQTVSQTSEFPTELKPFISDVLGKAQAIQEKREDEGYIPFEGPQVASFTPEQEQAFTGIQGLVGQGQGYFDPSTALAKSSAVAPTSEAVQAAMSPYTQNVVDIQQREALRQADVAQQQLGAQAVSAGGYGGSRMAILEAEQNRNTQQLLGDIQARGQAAAFEDAQTRLAQQSGRELAASGQLMNLGSVAPQQSLKELTAVEAVGAQRQAQSQQGLNIAKQQFEEEQVFPEQTLQQYQSVIRGFPLQANTYQQRQTTTPAPSFLQQAAGLGATGIGLAGAFGAFKAKGGLVSRMQGGQVDQTNGLGSIVVKRNAGQQVAPAGVVPPQTPMIGSISKAPISLSTEAINKAVADGRITRREAMLARQKLMEEGAKPTADDTAYLNKLRGVDFASQKAEAKSEYTKDVESVESNKWLALTKAGVEVLGQDGSKGTVGGIAAGVTSSGALDDLSKLAKEERQLAKDKRKELKGISSAELTNMASVAGISRKEADAMRDAQINAQNDIISEANTGIKEMTALAGLQKSDRQEYVAEQKVLLDYKTAIKKAGKEGGMKAADYNAVLKSVLDSYGAVVNKDERTGRVSIMIGNKALSGDLLRKINADKDKAVNAWIDSGGGNEGFKAVTNIFQKGGGNTNNDPLGIRN